MDDKDDFPIYLADITNNTEIKVNDSISHKVLENE